MRHFLFLIITLVIITLMADKTAYAETRVALIIGNGKYNKNIGALANPPNDARLMTNTLRSLDFEVIEVINSSQFAMKKAISAFGKRLDAAGKDGVGLFYYAGHGVQVKGANYLIPVDAPIETEGDVDLYAVNANAVLRMMEFSGARLSFVILDACRNNPFARGFRSASRGLARLEAPQGSLVAYATAPGNVAADGTGSNSPYTKALVKGLLSGQPVERMFREVRNDVMRETKKKQTPWESSSLTGGDFYFNQGKEALRRDPSTPSQQPAAADKETVFWQSIQNSSDPKMFEAYLSQYPNGAFALLARVKTNALKAAHVAKLTSPEPSFTVSPLDEEMVASKAANVRALPTVRGEKVARLSAGSRVNVTGKTNLEGANWFRVALARGKTGFVFAPLLKELPEFKPPPKVANVPSSIPLDMSEQKQYQLARNFLLKGEYEQAGVAMKEFIRRYPVGPLSNNARYWLGETLYVRSDYVKAAEIFLETYQRNPNGSKAPDVLLKLGMSMAKLGKGVEACVTFSKIVKDFPLASARLLTLVTQEQGRNSC